jgi:hypothetical protein
VSYDLMVFDPEKAPRDRAAFKDWYAHQAEWTEDVSNGDLEVTTPALRSWYQAIRQTFPNMNGPGAADDEHIDSAADYSIGRHVIYAAFPWSQAEDVYPLVRRLAVEHRVGFYDVSGDEGDGEIYFPGDELRPEPADVPWREVARQFKELRNQ